MVAVGALKGRKKTRFSVYSSHVVIGMACPDVWIRITTGSRIGLRSLYPRTFENLNHDLSKESRLWIIDYHIVYGGVCAIRLPFTFSFFLWCLGCLIFFADCLFQFKMFEFVYSFKIGLCVYCVVAFLSNCGFEGSFGTYCYSITGLPLSSIYLYAVYFSSW